MQLVDLSHAVPGALIDLRYATDRNVAGRAMYDAAFTARLDGAASRALGEAVQHFSTHNVRLLVWDAYRPKEVQDILLRLSAPAHRDTYVMQDSNHCRGRAVDVTLTSISGELLDMGTDHDDFSSKAHVNAIDLTPKQVANRQLLADGMQSAGFQPWPYEWWHFDYAGM